MNLNIASRALIKSNWYINRIIQITQQERICRDTQSSERFLARSAMFRSFLSPFPGDEDAKIRTKNNQDYVVFLPAYLTHERL